MRRVTITTGSPHAMRAMIPALIYIIHNMTVIARCGVIPEVRSEIGYIKNDSTESQDCHEANYQGIFHLLHLKKLSYMLPNSSKTACDKSHILLSHKTNNYLRCVFFQGYVRPLQVTPFPERTRYAEVNIISVKTSAPKGKENAYHAEISIAREAWTRLKSR